jgi:hypothetical protein
MGPHGADIDDRPAAAARDHAACHGLSQKEDRAVEFVVRVVGGPVVVEERLRSEHTGGVDQERGIGVLGCQLLLYPGDLVTAGEVGSDAPRRAVGRQGHHGLVNPALLAADDDSAAATSHHVGRGLPAHSTTAPDHDQLAILEGLGHDNLHPIGSRLLL